MRLAVALLCLLSRHGQCGGGAVVPLMKVTLRLLLLLTTYEGPVDVAVVLLRLL